MIRLLFSSVFALSCLLGSESRASEELPQRVEAALADLDGFARKTMEDFGIPGMAIAVVYDGRVVFAEGYGVRALGKSAPVDADTVFQLASISKPVGSTVIAALVGQGVVEWDTRIVDCAPSFAMSDPWITSQITITDLYSHRGGLPDHAGDELEDIGYGGAEISHRLRYQQPEYSFRSGYAYTNAGLTAAAVAAAEKAGKDWATLSEELLYRPLGMLQTSSRFSDFMERENKALGHTLEKDRFVHREQRNPDAQSPAGGVSSSANDMAKWMLLQLSEGNYEGQEIVASDALALSHQPVALTGFNPATKLPGFYGLGWDVRYDQEGRLRLGHSGAFSMGASTCVGLAPSEKLGIIVLTNGFPVGVPETIVNTFLDEALDGAVAFDYAPIFRQVFARMIDDPVAHIPDYTQAPDLPGEALHASAYLGTFRNDFVGELEVALNSEGHLEIHLGPEPQKLPLTHWSRDIFFYSPRGEGGIVPMGVTFVIGADGRADNLLLDQFSLNGNGWLQRVSDGESKE